VGPAGARTLTDSVWPGVLPWTEYELQIVRRRTWLSRRRRRRGPRWAPIHPSMPDAVATSAWICAQLVLAAELLSITRTVAGA
jgi:hypothetical protein